MHVLASIITACVLLFAIYALVNRRSPRRVMLHMYATASAVVVGAVAIVSHVDHERRLQAHALVKARRDAIRRQEEEVLLNTLRGEVTSGIDERLARSKGRESSEQIALLTCVQGSGTNGRGASQVVASSRAHGLAVGAAGD